MTNLDSIWKNRDIVANKGPSSQSYSFSSSHVWIWELDYKESWVLKNWCFWTVVLEKTLASPVDCKIKPVNPKGNQSWIFIARTDAEDETLYLGHLMQRTDSFEKTLMLGKVESGKRRGHRMRWLDGITPCHVQLHGHEFEQAPGVEDGQGSLACCTPWSLKESDMTEQLNWTDAHDLGISWICIS